MKGAARDSRSWAARPVQSAGAPIHLWEKDWAGQETQEATLARLGCPCQCHQGEAQAQAMMGTGMGTRESWAEALLTGAWGIALPLAQGLGFPTLPPPSARRAEGGSGITRRPGFLVQEWPAPATTAPPRDCQLPHFALALVTPGMVEPACCWADVQTKSTVPRIVLQPGPHRPQS